MVIRSFKDPGTDDIFYGRNTKAARRSCPQGIWAVAARKLDQLDSAKSEAPMIRVPTHREPTHPGEMLLEEFLKPMALSQKDLADGIHVPYQRINELVNKKRGMTPSTALRLSKFLGTSADYWMSLQLRWDLYQANRAEAAELKLIKRITPAG